MEYEQEEFKLYTSSGFFSDEDVDSSLRGEFQMLLYIARFLLTSVQKLKKTVTFCMKTQRDVTLFLFDTCLTLTKYLFGKKEVFVWLYLHNAC